MDNTELRTHTPSLAKAQREAISVLADRKPGNAEVVCRNLFRALAASKRYGELISSYQLTEQDLTAIIRQLLDYGLCWEKGIFMPVQIFSRKKPLRYVLENKDALLGNHGQEALFDAYNHLRKYFIQFLG